MGVGVGLHITTINNNYALYLVVDLCCTVPEYRGEVHIGVFPDMLANPVVDTRVETA